MKREPTRLSVTCEMPVAIPDLPRSLLLHAAPKYRILNIDCNRVEKQEWKLDLLFHPDDIDHNSTPNRTLFQIRDCVIAALSLTAMAPVLIRSSAFTFPLGNRMYEHRSLGPHTKEGAEMLVRSLGPLALASCLDKGQQVVSHFVWQALNTDEPVHRFINIAVALETLANTNSAVARTEAVKCPQCEHVRNAPTALRKRLSFILDEDLGREFNRARNDVLHGSFETLSGPKRLSLLTLNTKLLLAIRKHMEPLLMLQPMNAKDLGVRFMLDEFVVAIGFEDPEGHCSDLLVDIPDVVPPPDAGAS